jgi:general secretion pathway protein G
MILGLTSALVLPRLPAIYERFQDKSKQEELIQSLSTLSLKAYTRQQTLTLTKESAAEILGLTSDLNIRIDQPIVYHANGVCLGGRLSFELNGITRQLELAPPYCEPRPL